MLIKIIRIFLLFHLIWAQDLQINETYIGKFFNDALPKLELLQKENENLYKKIDLLNISTHQQLMTEQTELSQNLNELLTSIATSKQSQLLSPSFELKQHSNEINTIPADCSEALQKSGRKEGPHKIKVIGSELKPFYVYCFTNVDNAEGIDESIIANVTTSWTIIQRRRDGTVKFDRKWMDYKRGFGNIDGEFFIGLDKLFALTQSALHELWIQLEDFEGQTRWAKYNSFAIGDESEAYPINILGSYSGDAGDSLDIHIDQKFSTKDMDNDLDKDRNCAATYFSGWWHKKCFNSALNGVYHKDNTEIHYDGILWTAFRGSNYSLKYAHMAIRPISLQ